MMNPMMGGMMNPMMMGEFFDFLFIPKPRGPAMIEKRSNQRMDKAFPANGDVVLWQHVWPEVARHFKMEVGAAHPMSLATIMPSHAALWASIQRKYGLAPHRYEDIVGTAWQFADSIFGLGTGLPRSHLSTIKLRQAGFPDCIDSADMLIELLEELERRRVIPDPKAMGS